jgi:hypothetical protein
MDIATKFASG